MPVEGRPGQDRTVRRCILRGADGDFQVIDWDGVPPQVIELPRAGVPAARILATEGPRDHAASPNVRTFLVDMNPRVHSSDLDFLLPEWQERIGVTLELYIFNERMEPPRPLGGAGHKPI
jgi:hypothetical protein